MENKQQPTGTQGVAYWTNEVEYLRNALDGIITSAGIIRAMLDHAKRQLNDCESEVETAKEDHII